MRLQRDRRPLGNDASEAPRRARRRQPRTRWAHYRLFLEVLENRVVLSSVSWINPDGGDWDTASNWSSDAVPTAADNVTIGIAITNPVTHNSSSSDSVDSITSQDPLDLSGGSLSIGTMATLNASLTLDGGTVSGGPINLSNGATLVGTDNGGTLSGVTLDGTLDLATNSSHVTITNGLTLDGTIDLGNASGSTAGQLNFVGAQALGGTGSIVFGGSGGNAINTAANGDSGTLTIGSGITIDGKHGTIGYNNSGNETPLVNQGTIDNDVSGGGFNVYGANWTNSGTLQASNGGYLGLNIAGTNSGSIIASGSTVVLSQTWTNNGSITVNGGGEVDLYGTYSLGAGSSLEGSGGTVDFEGTLNNAGTTLALDNGSLAYVMNNGTIDGGTVAMTNGAVLEGPRGTLAGVTLDGTLDLATTGGAVTVTNGLTLDGTIDLGNASGSTGGALDFVGAQALGGTGSIVFGGSGGNAINTAANGDSGTLTIGSGITIDGKHGTIGYNNSGNETPLVNQGTIDNDVSGGGFNVYGANWTNSGTLQASNGGYLGLNIAGTNSGSIIASGSTVVLSQTWTNNGSITVNGGGEVDLYGTYSLGAGSSLEGSGGTVDFEGTLNNAGTTLALDNGSLAYVMNNGTIDGGTVAMTNGAVLEGPRGTLAGVTLDGTLDLATTGGAVTVTNGLTLDGTIDLGNASGSTGGALNFVGAQALGGTGSIVFGGSGGNAINTAANGDSGTLTIGSGITIDGKHGTIGYNNSGNETPLVNQGTIDNDVSGGGFNVYGANWTNSGTLQASNGGYLGLNIAGTNSGSIIASGSTVVLSQTWTNNGSITVNGGGEVDLYGTYSLGAGSSLEGSGGTVDFEGTLNNAGTTLALDNGSLAYVMNNGTIDGGTVAMTNGAVLEGPRGTLAGVTLDGTLDLATTGGAVTVTNGLTLDGTIDLGNASGSTGGALNFVGAQALGGTGSIVFGGSGGNAINTAANGDSGTLTIGSGITIDGKHGTIGYNNSGNETPLVNQGTIDNDVSGGGFNVYGANWTNSGTLQASNGGYLGLNIAGTNSGSIIASGSTVVLSQTWTNNGSITVNGGGEVDLYGTYSLGAGSSLEGSGGTVDFEGTLNNAGTTLALDNGSLAYVMNNGTIDGGTVAMTNGAVLEGPRGTLAGVTLDGTLDLATTGGAVTVTNGLTLDGTIDLGNASGSTGGALNFVGAQALGGTGSIVFGGSGGNAINTAANGDSGTLTIGSGITIDGKHGTIGYNNSGNETPLVNQGTIDNNVSGGSLEVYGTDWSSSGTLQASSGGYLELNGIESSSGILQAANGGTLSSSGGALTSTGVIAANATSTVNLSNSSVTINSSGVVVVQPSATMNISGSIFGNTTDADLFEPQGAINLEGTGTSSIPQFLEVMGNDLGNVTAGFSDNFAYGTLALASNNYVRLVDLQKNSGALSPEALYVNTLIVPSGSTLDLNGLKLYYRVGEINGTITAGSATPLLGGGPLPLNSSAPGNIQVASGVDDWSFYGRSGESVDVFLHTGNGGTPAPIQPDLDYGQVTLLDPNGHTIAVASNSQSGMDASILNELLTTDGTYKIEVQAASGHSASLGNYVVAAYEAGTYSSFVDLDQTVYGQLNSPYSQDQWTFSATANTQVQLDLIASANPSLQFSFTGPDDFTGFSGLSTSSSLVTLPRSGTYVLDLTTSQSADGGGAYAFQLIQTSQTDLTLGAPYEGTLAGSGQAQIFVVNVPSSEPMLVSLQDNSTTDNDELYVMFGAPPTAQITSIAVPRRLGDLNKSSSRR